MQWTTVRVERPEGTVLTQGVPVQIEAATALHADVVELAGARQAEALWLYTTAGVPVPPLRRGDLLVDERLLDAETGLPARYRIVGAVETFESDHQEALCQRVVGR